MVEILNMPWKYFSSKCKLAKRWVQLQVKRQTAGRAAGRAAGHRWLCPPQNQQAFELDKTLNVLCCFHGAHVKGRHLWAPVWAARHYFKITSMGTKFLQRRAWKRQLPSTGDVLSLAHSPPTSPYRSWILVTDSAPRSSMSERSSCSEQLNSASWLASPCRPCLEARPRSELLAMVPSTSDSEEAFPKNTDSEVSQNGGGGLMGTHWLWADR